MATGGCEDTSDEIFNFKCTSCDKANTRREAVKYCVECQGYCCQSCADIHKVFPTLVGHKLLDKSDFKSSLLTTDLPSIPTELCNIHEVKIIDMYCGNHDVVGCTSCMSLDHRSCTDVQLIPDVVETIFKKSDADDINLKLQEKTTEMDKMRSSKESLLEVLNKSRTEALKAIRTFRKEMETVLKNLEKESIKEIEKEYQKMKSILEDQMKKSKNEMDNMKRALDDLKQSSDGNKAQHFVSMKTAQKKITVAGDILLSLTTPVNAKVHYIANVNVQNLLQELKVLGSLGSVRRNTVYTVTGTRELNIKMQQDTSTCSVCGSCLTEDGKLLLADYYNKKLKRANIVNLSVEDHCDLSHSPWGVCCTSKHEAAVSLYNKSIQFVSLGNKMTLTREIKLNHVCFGIAYNNEKLYITDNRRSLYIHDMAGNLLHTVSLDNSGKNIFSNCRNIAFGDSGNKVFVTDGYNNLVVLDKQGKHINSLVDADINFGSGVCTDSRGNIFVCGYRSKNVVQFSENGTERGIVVKTSDRLNNAWSLAFDPQLGILCVTQHASNTVKLFDLK